MNEQAVVTRDPWTPNALTPMDMLNQAVERGANIDVLTKLMDLHERWERNQARKEFDAAIADAKREIAPVARNATGHNNKRYADFSAYARAIDPIISKFGLSYRFRTSQTDRINVTCILSHKAGHAEETTLAGPPDKTGSKNDIQAIGSTLTYLQRYTLVQALGLAAGDDDDGKTAGRQIAEDAVTVSPGQLEELQIRIEDAGVDPDWLLSFLKPRLRIETFADIPASRLDEVFEVIAKKGKQK